MNLRWVLHPFLATAALFLHVNAVPADDAADADEALLKAAGVGADGPSLIAFLRAHRPREVPDLAKLIRDLGDDLFAERERASRALVAVGRTALPALRAALKNDDREVVRRAEDCIRAIREAEKGAPPEVHAAVVRSLSRRRPAEGAVALLAYLPAAPTGDVEEEVWTALDAFAERKTGVLDSAVLDALKDASPLRRAAAACLVGRRGVRREEVRKRLSDAEPLVRLRAAQGLLAGGDASGLSALIALLEATPIDVAWQAEELLHWTAGADAPVEVVGAGAAKERSKCKEAWEAWRKELGEKVDVERLLKEPRRPGLFLVSEYVEDREDRFPMFGRARSLHCVSLYGCDGSLRWRLLEAPILIDLQLLPEGRVLLAEPSGLVTERDLEGKIVWKIKENEENLLSCRRLPNGNTFLVLKHGMREINEFGAEVFVHQLKRAQLHNRSTLGVGRLANGNLLYQQEERKEGFSLLEVDARTGDSVRLSRIEGLNEYSRDRGLRGLPLGEGRVVFITPFEGLQEVGPTGKLLKVHRTEYVQDAAPSLRGRRVFGYDGQGKGRVVELDYVGRARWEVLAEGDVRQVRSCLPLVRLGFPEPNFTVGDASSLACRSQGLHSKSAQVRRRSADAVGLSGPKALSVAPALSSLLGDPELGVRQSAGSALNQIGPGVVAVLVKGLKSKNPTARATTAFQLGGLGRHARVATPELIENLRDDDDEVRQEAAFALSRVGPAARAAEARLIEAVEDPEKLVGCWAIEALEKLASESPRSLDALLTAASKSKHHKLRGQALGSLARTGVHDKRIVAALVAALKDQDGRVRERAVESLGQLGADAKPAVPALVAVCQNDILSGGRVRTEVLRAINKLGPNASEAVPFLIAEYKRTKDYWILVCLGKTGPAAKEARPLILAALEVEKDGWTNGSLFSALAGLGPEAAPVLIERLAAEKDPRGIDHRFLLEAIQRLGPDAKDAVPELLDWIKRIEYPEEYLETLRAIGPGAKAAIPALLAELKSLRHQRGDHAAYALAKIAPKDEVVVAALRQALRDAKQHDYVRGAIAWALSEIGPGAEAAVPEIVAFLESLPDPANPPLSSDGKSRLFPIWFALQETAITKDSSPVRKSCSRGSRLQVIMALREFGPEAKVAVPALGRVVGKKAGELPERWCAMLALAQIGPSAKAAAPDLADVLRSPEEATILREQATQALTQIGLDAVPDLLKVVEGKDWAGRLMALEALEAMGPPARAAVPALKTLARGDDVLLARAADMALARIQPDPRRP